MVRPIVGERSVGRRFVVGSVGAAALAGAFFVGRATAPDSSAIAGPDCSKAGRSGIAVPEEFTNEDGIAFFSQCEEQAAMGKILGEPALLVKIYSSETGSDVVAWWYPDCGMPEGVFPVGTPHPAKCAEVSTTAAAP